MCLCCPQTGVHSGTRADWNKQPNSSCVSAGASSLRAAGFRGRSPPYCVIVDPGSFTELKCCCRRRRVKSPADQWGLQQLVLQHANIIWNAIQHLKAHSCSAAGSHGELLQSRGCSCSQRLSSALRISCCPSPLHHIKELTRSLRSNYLTWLLAVTAEGESCLQRLHSQTSGDIIIDATFQKKLHCEESVSTSSAVRICCIRSL